MQPTTTTTELTVADQLSLVPAPNAMFGINLTAAIAENADRLAAIPSIANDTERVTLDSFLKEAKSVRKRCETQRMDITRILDTVKTAYTSTEKQQTAELDKQIGVATTTLNTYLREQLRQQQEREAQIREQAEKEARRKRSLESKGTVIAAAEQAVAEVQIVPTSGVRMVWVFEVVDPTTVPEAYKIVNEAAVRTAIASGTREIPGVRIYQDISRSGR